MEISIFFPHGCGPLCSRLEAGSENFPQSVCWPTLLVIDFRLKTVVIVLSRNGFIYFGHNLSTVTRQS